MGYLNGSWATPKGHYSLPLPVSDCAKTVSADFAYADLTAGDAGRAACIAAILRSDYDGDSFDSAANPSAEVFVCPIFTPSAASTPVTMGGVTYRRIVGGGLWPSLTYVPGTAANLTGLNLSAIIADAVSA